MWSLDAFFDKPESCLTQFCQPAGPALSIRNVFRSTCGHAAFGLCLHCSSEGWGNSEKCPSHWRTGDYRKGKTLSFRDICLVCRFKLLKWDDWVLPYAQTGANDLQTLADRLAQQSICASLAQKFPQITIIGEEVSFTRASFHLVLKTNQCEMVLRWFCLISGSQELPSEEISNDLIENGHSEEILQRTCPEEYSEFKEEEVRSSSCF